MKPLVRNALTMTDTKHTNDPEIHSYLTRDSNVYLAPPLRKWLREQKNVVEAETKWHSAQKDVCRQRRVVNNLEEKKENDFLSVGSPEWEKWEDEYNSARFELTRLGKESTLAGMLYATEERFALMQCPEEMIDQVVLVDEKNPDRREGRRFRHTAKTLYDYLNGALEGDLVFNRGGYARNNWWLYFSVSYRTLEQGMKLLAKSTEHKHNLHELYANLPESQRKNLEHGYDQGQLLFQTHWRTLPHLLRYADKTRNAKEYYLLNPQTPGAAVDPILPFVLAYLAMQVGEVLQGMKKGMNNSANYIQKCIAEVFLFGAGKWDYPKMNFLVSWQRIFRALFPYKVRLNAPSMRRVRYMDGTQINENISFPLVRSPDIWGYSPANEALEEILPIFDGDEIAAGGYLCIAELLINKRDWMLQLFIQRSEAHAGPAQILSRFAGAPVDDEDEKLTEAERLATRKS